MPEWNVPNSVRIALLDSFRLIRTLIVLAVHLQRADDGVCRYHRDRVVLRDPETINEFVPYHPLRRHKTEIDNIYSDSGAVRG